MNEKYGTNENFRLIKIFKNFLFSEKLQICCEIMESTFTLETGN